MIDELLIVISSFICLLMILISKFSKHKLRPISMNHREWKSKVNIESLKKPHNT